MTWANADGEFWEKQKITLVTLISFPHKANSAQAAAVLISNLFGICFDFLSPVKFNSLLGSVLRVDFCNCIHIGLGPKSTAL